MSHEDDVVDASWSAGWDAGYASGREAFKETVRGWLESKSSGVTKGRLLEDLEDLK